MLLRTKCESEPHAGWCRTSLSKSKRTRMRTRRNLRRLHAPHMTRLAAISTQVCTLLSFHFPTPALHTLHFPLHAAVSTLLHSALHAPPKYTSLSTSLSGPPLQSPHGTPPVSARAEKSIEGKVLLGLVFQDEKRHLSTLPRLPLAAGLETAGRMCFHGLGDRERAPGRRREELKPPITY